MDPEREDYVDLDRPPLRLPPGWVLDLVGAVLVLAAAIGAALFLNWFNP